jgi:hypothetical protein
MSGFLTLNAGAAANDDSGDSLRAACLKINDNLNTTVRALASVSDLGLEIAASGYFRIVAENNTGGLFVAYEGGTVDNVTYYASATVGWTWQRVNSITSHLGDTDNPHQVTKIQIGLGNVDNTSDAGKPISDLAQAAFDLKANSADVTLSLDSKADANLGNVPSGSVTLALLSAEITSLLGTGFDPALGQGDWNPGTNTPTLPSAGASGTWYRVSVDGTASGTNADGDYLEDDIVVDNGSDWVLFRFPTNNIVDGSVTFAKLSELLQSFLNNNNRHDIIYSVSGGDDGRSPFYINADGEAYIKLMADMIDGGMIQDGVIDYEKISSTLKNIIGNQAFRPDAGYNVSDEDGRRIFGADSLGNFLLGYYLSLGPELSARHDVAMDVVDNQRRLLIRLFADGKMSLPLADESINSGDLIADDIIETRHLVDKSGGSVISKVFGEKRRLLEGVYASTQKWADSGFAWKRLPRIECDRILNARSRDSTDLLIRNNTDVVAGIEMDSTWNPADAFPDFGSARKYVKGRYVLVTHTAGGYTAGDRIVFQAINDHTTTYPWEPGDGDSFWETNPDGLYHRGTWDPTSGSYPADSNKYDDDYWEVVAAGSYDSVTYAVGDKLIRDSSETSNYRKWSTPIITTVTSASSETFECENSADEYEIRAEDGTVINHLIFDTFMKVPVAAYTATVGDKNNVWFEDGFSGSLNKLTTLNGAYNNWNPQLSDDGMMLSFTSDRSGSAKRYFAPTETSQIYDVAFEVFEAETVGDSVVITGDSMASRLFDAAESAIDANDTANGRANRTFVDRGFASADPWHITDVLNYSAFNHSTNGNAVQIIFLDRGELYLNEVRSELFQKLNWIRSNGKKFIVCSIHQLHTMSFATGPDRVEPVHGIGTSVYNSCLAIEAWLESVLGDNYINVRTLINAEATTDPDPQFPGLTEQEVVEQYGIYPYRFQDVDNTWVGANLSNLVEARFQGYRPAIPVSSGAVTYDYWICDGTSTDEAGGLYVWNGTSWIHDDPDDTHLSDSANEIIADRIVELFNSKNF